MTEDPNQLLENWKPELLRFYELKNGVIHVSLLIEKLLKLQEAKTREEEMKNTRGQCFCECVFCQDANINNHDKEAQQQILDDNRNETLNQ